MEVSCVGSRNKELLMERYPEIAFLLNYTAFSPCVQEVNHIQPLQLAGVDVLYFIGVELGCPYETFKSWLKEKPGRVLIFLEDDLAAIEALLQTDLAEKLICDPQVHLQYVEDLKSADEILKELAHMYPSHQIEVSSCKRRAQLCKQVRLKLMRQSAIVNALMTEALYSHRLVENVLANIRRWPYSFFANHLKNKFKGIPAIICGAGPSLGPTLPLLNQLEDRALIIAGGSTITALSNQGIIPHLGLALDPNPEEYSRLRVMSAYEMPLLYGTRVQPDVFNTCNGPWGYIHSYTGGPCEAYFEREFDLQGDPVGPDLGPEAFSVTTLAIALAVEMGCSPILLNGIDLAYTGMQRYAAGVMPSSEVFFQDLQKETRASERLLKRKGIKGSMVYTLVKWVMESSSIANYAKAHGQAEFINVSSGGLGFKGVPNLPLSKAIQEHCHRSLDLRAMVHHEIEQSRLKQISSEAIAEKMSSIADSLEKLLELCDAMLAELERLKTEDGDLPTGKMTLLQLDFEEEKAFDCFLPHVGPAIDRLLNRSHAISPDASQQQIRFKTLERLVTKWQHIRMMIEKETAFLCR